MSLTALFVFGILALDFIIYYGFLSIFGDRRAALAREVARMRAQVPALPGPVENRISNTIPSRRNTPSYSAGQLHRTTVPTLESLQVDA
jgi:hypothetical protein